MDGTGVALWAAMNAFNALVFLVLGVAMAMLPVVEPSWFPPTGIYGSSGRALWLEVMGVLQGVIGGVRVLRDLAVPFVLRSLTYDLGAGTASRPISLVQAQAAEAA